MIYSQNKLKHALSIMLILAMIISTFYIASFSTYADDEVAPEAPYLFVQEVVSGTDEAPVYTNALFLQFNNSTDLIARTNSIREEALANQSEYLNLTIQLQTKIDSESWTTTMVGSYGTISEEDMTSQFKLYDPLPIDLTAHTFYVRARYAWTTTNEGVYYSNWSELSTIGKEASITAPPTRLDSAPLFTNVSLDFAENEYPQFNLEIGDVPENIAQHISNPSGNLMLNIMISENGGEYRSIRFQPVSNMKTGQTMKCSILDKNNSYEHGYVTLRARYEWYTGGIIYYGAVAPTTVSAWSTEYTVNVAPWANAADWALPELEKALQNDLIPDCLLGKDLQKSITRTEFTSVALKTYEALADTSVSFSSESPFTDCTDPDVLKAYSVGIVNGTSATTFSPDENLSREQAAVMMTRVYKLIAFDGWTLETDNEFKLEYDQPNLFSDDSQISDYAKDSVYFMESNNIINGVGNNTFAPKNITTAQINSGYANATRQQALIIAQRMLDNLAPKFHLLEPDEQAPAEI